MQAPGPAQSFLRGALALLGPLALMSCALVVSFDAYDTSSSTPFYTVGGQVDGLAQGAQVTLTLNTTDLTRGLKVADREAFVFPEMLADGQSFEIRAYPQSDHTCTVVGGAAAIAGSSVGIAVHCAPNDARLCSLTPQVGALEPPFDPMRDATQGPYTVRVTPFAMEPSIVATACDPRAKIRVNDTDVLSGRPSAPIVAVAKAIDVTVTAADHLVSDRPTTRRYALLVASAKTDYLKASNTRAYSGMGYAVALAGDTLAVGARYESTNERGVNPGQLNASQARSGAVYVFRRKGNVWSQEAFIKASNTLDSTYFGASVALSGDTLVVGSPGERSRATGIDQSQIDKSMVDAGAAYVFTRIAGLWSQEAYVKASNTRAGARFGTSVALSGDTLAVGSDGETSNGTSQADASSADAGAAYVFTRAAGLWSQQAYVKASNPRVSALFGSSIALAGNTLAVGALGESSGERGVNGTNQADSSAPGAGAAYVFTRSGDVWSQQAYVKASNPRTKALFGTSIAVAGDTLVVGSEGEASGATGVGGNQGDASLVRAGAAYVFTRAAGAWSQQAYVKASNSRQEARFGSAVSLVGDTLAVGSAGESSNATDLDGDQANTSQSDSGAAYVFRRSGTAWSQYAYAKASNTRGGAQFGRSVALSVDGLVVGSPGESGAAAGVNAEPIYSAEFSGAGAAYVFR